MVLAFKHMLGWLSTGLNSLHLSKKTLIRIGHDYFLCPSIMLCLCFPSLLLRTYLFSNWDPLFNFYLLFVTIHKYRGPEVADTVGLNHLSKALANCCGSLDCGSSVKEYGILARG